MGTGEVSQMLTEKGEPMGATNLVLRTLLPPQNRSDLSQERQGRSAFTALWAAEEAVVPKILVGD